MKLILTLVFISVIYAGVPAVTDSFPGSGNKPDHTAWTDLLQEHVAKNGEVDYAAFKQDLPRLNSYLDYLAGLGNKVKSWQRKEKLAYYINLYNAATIKLVLDNYPLSSILDIDKPFEREWIAIGNKTVSLSHIENDILREMGEPRIHFAINCASYSCPKLLDHAFIADKLEEQLEKVTRDFINDPKHNTIQPDSLELSNIFNWYNKDFIEDGSLIDYINAYTDTDISDDAEIVFLKYNWSLNDAR